MHFADRFALPCLKRQNCKQWMRFVSHVILYYTQTLQCYTLGTLKVSDACFSCLPVIKKAQVAALFLTASAIDMKTVVITTVFIYIVEINVKCNALHFTI